MNVIKLLGVVLVVMVLSGCTVQHKTLSVCLGENGEFFAGNPLYASVELRGPALYHSAPVASDVTGEAVPVVELVHGAQPLCAQAAHQITDALDATPTETVRDRVDGARQALDAVSDRVRGGD